MIKRCIYILLGAAVLLMTSAAGAAAQHYVGVRGGWGGGSGRFYPKPSESGTVWGLYHGGVSWKYYSRQKSVGGVQVDVLFMQQGYRNYELSYVPPGSDELPDRLSYYQRTVNTVTIPAYWQSYAYLFERKMRVFLNLGVTFSYNFTSREEYHSYVNPQESYSNDYPMQSNRDNPLSYGLAGGVGIGWSVGRTEILAEARYWFGYGDILRNRNRYELNPLRSPLDNMQVSIGVYRRLGKGGILAPPGPKLAAKMEAAAERRATEQLTKEMERTAKEAKRIMEEGGIEDVQAPREKAVIDLLQPGATDDVPVSEPVAGQGEEAPEQEL